MYSVIALLIALLIWLSVFAPREITRISNRLAKRESDLKKELDATYKDK